MKLSEQIWSNCFYCLIILIFFCSRVSGLLPPCHFQTWSLTFSLELDRMNTTSLPQIDVSMFKDTSFLSLCFFNLKLDSSSTVSLANDLPMSHDTNDFSWMYSKFLAFLLGYGHLNLDSRLTAFKEQIDNSTAPQRDFNSKVLHAIKWS